MKSKYSVIFTVVLSMMVGFSSYALADWSMAGSGFKDDPDCIPVFKYWEKKMGTKQFNICMRADTSQPAVQERCGDQLGELCWSIKSKKDGLTCKAMANLFKINAYAAFMERAAYRGDRKAYRFYEDRLASTVAVNDQLVQAHAQTEGSQLTEEKRTDAEKKADEYFERGVRNRKAGKYKEAIIDFSNYIELDLVDSAAYFNRGICYAELDNHEKAIIDFSKAIEIDPQDANYFSGRGYSYLKIKKCEAAISDYTRAIELNPDNNYTNYINRATCKCILTKYQQAIPDYTKAIELKPDRPEGYFYRGQTYRCLSLEQKAMEDYKKAAELGSKDAQAILSAKK